MLLLTSISRRGDHAITLSISEHFLEKLLLFDQCTSIEFGCLMTFKMVDLYTSFCTRCKQIF